MKVYLKMITSLGIVLLMFPATAMEQIVHRKDEPIAQPSLVQEKDFLTTRFNNQTDDSTIISVYNGFDDKTKESLYTAKPLIPGQTLVSVLKKSDFPHWVDLYAFTYRGQIVLLKFGKMTVEEQSTHQKEYYMAILMYARNGTITQEELDRPKGFFFSWGDNILVNISREGLNFTTVPAAFKK